MRSTTFAEEEFESEKLVVEEELRIGLDGPWESLENEVWATAFRQHPYHWPTVGWIQDLEAASANDMKAYYDKWYHPRNAILVIVGDFNTADVLGRVEELFGSIPTGPPPAPLGIVEPPQRGEKRLIVRKQTPVERLFIAYHAPEVAHADSYTLKVVEAILATGKASRLYQRLLEHDQSVTKADASYNDHIDPSLFYLQAELKPGFNLPDVERAILEETDRLKRGDLSDAEIERAKRQIESSLVLSSEEPLQQAMLLGQYETISCGEQVPPKSRGFHYLDSLLERIDAVTGEDIARVTHEHFTEDNRTVGYLIHQTRTTETEHSRAA
jgi:zinc protease